MVAVCAVVSICQCYVCHANVAANGCCELCVAQVAGVLATDSECEAGERVRDVRSNTVTLNGCCANNCVTSNCVVVVRCATIGSRQVHGQVAHFVRYFNTVLLGCTGTTGRVRIAIEVICGVVVTQTGQAQIDWVHARHEFQSAVDVANANFKTTGFREEANAVQASAGAAIILVDAGHRTEGNTHVGFCCCSDLQAEARCDVGGRNVICCVEDVVRTSGGVVQNTKAAVATKCYVCCCYACGCDQGCCSEENFFHELSHRFEFTCPDRGIRKGYEGLLFFCPSFGKDRETVCLNVENSDAALPQSDLRGSSSRRAVAQVKHLLKSAILCAIRHCACR